MTPRGFNALALFAIQDDPVAIAARALDEKFNGAVANREIAAALAAKDSDLAQSFVDLAAERHVAIDPQLAADVTAARAQSASARGQAASFTRGLITGEPTDGAALAGTARWRSLRVRRSSRPDARGNSRRARRAGRRTGGGLGGGRRRDHRRHLRHARRHRAFARRPHFDQGRSADRATERQSCGRSRPLAATGLRPRTGIARGGARRTRDR